MNRPETTAPNDLLAIHARRIVLVVWLVAAAVLAVRMAAMPLRHSIFSAFERGHAAWWSDEFYYEHELDYVYTPTFTIAYSAIGWMPNWLAAPLWTLIGLAAAWCGLRAFLRDIVPTRLDASQEAAVMLLSLFGMFRGLWAAQANALVIGLALLAVAAVSRRQWWKASVLLAIPIYIKLWPAALAMLLLPLRARQLAGRFAMACLGLAALPWLTRPWSIVWRQHAGYVDLLLYRRVDARFSGYRDFWTIWEQFQTPNPHLYHCLQLAAAAAVFGVCVWLAWRRRERVLWTGMLGLWLAWQMLLGPGTERLTFGVIAPLMSWAVVESFRIGRLRTLSITAFALFFVLGTGSIEKELLPYFPGADAIAPVGIVLFTIWLTAYLTQSLAPGPKALSTDTGAAFTVAAAGHPALAWVQTVQPD